MASLCHFRAEYKLKSDLKLPCVVSVRIANCKDASTAQQLMAGYFSTWSSDIRTFIKKAERQLGQVALQSAKGVYWVRDALWGCIYANYEEKGRI